MSVGFNRRSLAEKPRRRSSTGESLPVKTPEALSQGHGHPPALPASNRFGLSPPASPRLFKSGVCRFSRRPSLSSSSPSVASSSVPPSCLFLSPPPPLPSLPSHWILLPPMYRQCHVPPPGQHRPAYPPSRPCRAPRVDELQVVSETKGSLSVLACGWSSQLTCPDQM